MPCDDLPDDLKILWKEAGTAQPVFSPDQLRKEAEKLQGRQRRANLILSVACACALAGYCFSIFYFHRVLIRVGSSLSVLLFGYMVVHVMLERWRAVPDPGESDGVCFYRTELERRRDWHHKIGWWLPMLAVPLIVVDLDLAQMVAYLSPLIAPAMWSWAVFLLAVLGMWAPAKHRRLAREYQHRIDALDSAVKYAGQTEPKD